MQILKVTTAAGDVFEEPYDESSQLTITHPEQGTKSWGEVVNVETVEKVDAPEPVASEPEPAPAPPPLVETPELASPEAALAHAGSLPIDDADAHVTAALAKWPDDPDLLAAKAELDEIKAASQQA